MAEWYALARIGQGSDAFKKSVTLDLTKLPEKIRDLFRPTNKQRNNFDFVQTKDGIIYEVKAGYPNGAVDLDQMHNYNLLVQLTAVDKNQSIIDELSRIGILGGKVFEVNYIVLAGKSANINQSGNVAEAIGRQTEAFNSDFFTSRYFGANGTIR